jgi:hypothetical protein
VHHHHSPKGADPEVVMDYSELYSELIEQSSKKYGVVVKNHYIDGDVLTVVIDSRGYNEFVLLFRDNIRKNIAWDIKLMIRIEDTIAQAHQKTGDS